MRTVINSGRSFDLMEPWNSDYTVQDIAHALSHLCRFGGHTDEFYSVAQHSVLVSCVVNPAYAMHALMHDASEAFLGDVVRPLKALLPDYTKIERRVEEDIFTRFGLPSELPSEVVEADQVLLATEMRDLMPKSDLTFDVRPIVSTIIPVPPAAAYNMFMLRFRALGGEA